MKKVNTIRLSAVLRKRRKERKKLDCELITPQVDLKIEVSTQQDVKENNLEVTSRMSEVKKNNARKIGARES